MRKTSNRTVIASLVAAICFGFVQSQTAHAACSIYFTNSTGGTLAGSTEIVAYGPTSFSCTGGVFTGTLHYTSPAFMRVRLEKQNAGGTWSVVDGPATSIGYTGNPGTYRYVVQNLQSFASPWTLDYKVPVS